LVKFINNNIIFCNILNDILLLHLKRHFKAMVMLVPGYNNFTFEFHDPVTQNFYSTELHMYYLPLLQNPPLHLAILVASDSEEVFDVPRYKDEYSVNGLDKAIEKLRYLIILN